jgi:hypothetical protein
MTFDENSRRRISRTVQGFESQNFNGQPRIKNWPSATVEPAITIQAPAAGILSANGLVFGSAQCDVLIGDGSEWKKAGTAEVWNPVETEDGSAVLTEGLRLGWCLFDGSRYVLISKLCRDDRTFVAADEIETNPPADPEPTFSSSAFMEGS